MSSTMGVTPADIIFGRQIRHPLIGLQSLELWYIAKPGTKPEPCTFVVQNSERTVYIECNGVARLAHIDQLRDRICKTDEKKQNISEVIDTSLPTHTETDPNNETEWSEEELIDESKQIESEVEFPSKEYKAGQRRHRKAPGWMREYTS